MGEGKREGRARGRPPLPAGEGKLYAVGFRTSKKVKDFLQQMADSGERSIAQEIEQRLLQSYDFEGTLGGPRATAFFRKLAEAVERVSPDERWLDDYQLFRTVRSLLVKTIDDLAPPTPEPIDVAIRLARDGLQTILGAGEFLGSEVREAALSFARNLADNPRVPADVRADLSSNLAEIQHREAS